MSWRGGWVLLLKEIGGRLVLTIYTPMAISMTIVVSEKSALLRTHGEAIKDGLLWVAIPSLGRACGPIGLAEYLNHKCDVKRSDSLSKLTLSKTRKLLPPCK
jgi:hypothetical protein